MCRSEQVETFAPVESEPARLAPACSSNVPHVRTATDHAQKVLGHLNAASLPDMTRGELAGHVARLAPALESLLRVTDEAYDLGMDEGLQSYGEALDGQ